jgi:hypothetical protein
MRCKTCGSSEVTVVGFTSGDGSTYRYCRYCETGAWESEGQELETTQMLTLASAIEPGRRRSAA